MGPNLLLAVFAGPRYGARDALLALPDVRKRLLDSGIDAVSNTPQQFAAYVREETTRWAAVIRNANVKVE